MTSTWLVAISQECACVLCGGLSEQDAHGLIEWGIMPKAAGCTPGLCESGLT